MKEKIVRLFLDMDGTTARFYESEDALEKMWEKGFFFSLKPYTGAIKALERLSAEGRIKIYIISACINPRAVMEKIQWLAKHMPFISMDDFIFVSMDEVKAEFVPGGIQKGDILFDDYTKNLNDWMEQGGNPVKAINEINDRTKMWTGHKISVLDDCETVYNNLLKIIENT